MKRVAKRIGVGLLWLAVALCLAVTIVPRYLDRVYYRGPASAHFDGRHFFNPDGADDVLARPPSFLARYLTGSDGRPAWPATVATAQATPAQLLQPFPASGNYTAADAAAERAAPLVVTWIGHASVLVQSAGLNILTDPVWSDTVGPFGIGPRRVAKPGIALADLPKIDVVLISHNHYDHLDLPTLRKLWERDRPLIVTSLGNDAILRSAGIGATALDWGGSVTVEGRSRVDRAHYWTKPVKVFVTRNHHWDSRWFADRNRALWSSFVVTLPGGNLFFAGDTGLGDGQWANDAARLGPIRLALVPIGAFRFAEGQMESGSHIGPLDAVEVYRRLGAAHALAIHWGTFRLSYEARDTPPRMLKAAMACTGQTGFAAVPIGVPQRVPAIGARAVATPVAREAVLQCLDAAGGVGMR